MQGRSSTFRVQSEEEVLGYVRDLGCVFEIEDEVGAAVSVVCGEVAAASGLNSSMNS